MNIKTIEVTATINTSRCGIYLYFDELKNTEDRLHYIVELLELEETIKTNIPKYKLHLLPHYQKVIKFFIEDYKQLSYIRLEQFSKLEFKDFNQDSQSIYENLKHQVQEKNSWFHEFKKIEKKLEELESNNPFLGKPITCSESTTNSCSPLSNSELKLNID